MCLVLFGEHLDRDDKQEEEAWDRARVELAARVATSKIWHPDPRSTASSDKIVANAPFARSPPLQSSPQAQLHGLHEALAIGSVIDLCMPKFRVGSADERAHVICAQGITVKKGQRTCRQGYQVPCRSLKGSEDDSCRL